jgi:alanine-glyoxylate transaminase/serine-glyoxylate transaminase/serine-pyruvate transaminase
MLLDDPVLMGPGPSNCHPAVLAALGAPIVGHLDPIFLGELDETCARLRRILRTDNALTYPVSGTGSAGVEAALGATVHPGADVVVGCNGYFGERMAEMASRLGARVHRAEASWGEPLDPDLVLGTHPAPDVIAVVHAETSTGIRNDVARIAAAKGDALLVVDAVTSLGGIPVEVDAWGIDVCSSATQKCLGAPPGLAPITFSERALARRVEHPSSWYLDPGPIAEYVSGGGARRYHHTAPVPLVRALNVAAGLVLDEGLEGVWERHQACGARLRQGLDRLGLEVLGLPDALLPQLAVVDLSPVLAGGTDEAGLRHRLRTTYGIEVGAGVGPYAGRVWRIGSMGHGASPRNVALLLAALEEVLGR